MKPFLNQHTRDVGFSPTLAIHQGVAELRAAGHEVIHFGFGEAPFPAPQPIVEALRAHADDTCYPPSQGMPELRAQAADYLRRRFGHEADADGILVGPGSKELIFDALMILKGDLILPSPSWVSYAPQGRMLGKRIIWAQTHPAAGYRLTPDIMAAACARSSAPQKIMILNSPCNPTGAVYTRQELSGFAELARKHNVIIISDEIYAEITFVGEYESMSRFCPERTIVTTGLSKGFCTGGYRLGIMLVPQAMGDVMRSLVSVASETFSCVCAPVQHAAVVAFSNDKRVREHVADAVQIHRIAVEYL